MAGKKQGKTFGGITHELSNGGQFSMGMHMENIWEGLHQGEHLLG